MQPDTLNIILFSGQLFQTARVIPNKMKIKHDNTNIVLLEVLGTFKMTFWILPGQEISMEDHVNPKRFCKTFK